MTNKRLEFLRGYIGKEFKGSLSPYSHWLKGKPLEVKEGALTFEFLVRKEMTNPIGTLHGGVIAGMIDEVMGVTFFTLNTENFYPTISLNIDYISSATEGENVRVTTSVIKKGKTVITLRAEVKNKEDKLLAQASSNIVFSNFKIPLHS